MAIFVYRHSCIKIAEINRDNLSAVGFQAHLGSKQLLDISQQRIVLPDTARRNHEWISSSCGVLKWMCPPVFLCNSVFLSKISLQCWVIASLNLLFYFGARVRNSSICFKKSFWKTLHLKSAWFKKKKRATSDTVVILNWPHEVSTVHQVTLSGWLKVYTRFILVHVASVKID